MQIPTEPIGSIPRPPELVQAFLDRQAGRISRAAFDRMAEAALRDTLERFAATGSPVISDGEQTKSSFATYPLEDLHNLVPGGVVIPFADGHTRQLPSLAAGPFRYGSYADGYLSRARAWTTLPLKQAVISVSALSLLYPASGLADYPRETFLADLVEQGATDIRRCLDAGADSVQIDFTEARLSLKLDSSGGLLNQFIDLNNRVLEEFPVTVRRRIGVHTCPGGDRDSTHSADVPYSSLLPSLFRLKVGQFYIQLASEKEPAEALRLAAQLLRPDQRLFVGVTDPITPEIETAEQVRDRILAAASHIPSAQLGTTDDCGFAPFLDDTSTSRDIAFAKIRARVAGTELASRELSRKHPEASAL
jgi:5-methyltetrahydropteroyltriglutamate--homocysteine methyltransferase